MKFDNFNNVRGNKVWLVGIGLMFLVFVGVVVAEGVGLEEELLRLEGKYHHHIVWEFLK